jgi:hypothetical protein
MKFIVDEMPFWESDCPFYADGGCACDGHKCVYMSYPAGHRDPEDCRWLVAKEDAK